jgi:hypothetical protein
MGGALGGMALGPGMGQGMGFGAPLSPLYPSAGMGQGSMGQGSMGQGSMGQGSMGQGSMGQGIMGQGSIGQGSMKGAQPLFAQVAAAAAAGGGAHPIRADDGMGPLQDAGLDMRHDMPLPLQQQEEEGAGDAASAASASVSAALSLPATAQQDASGASALASIWAAPLSAAGTNAVADGADATGAAEPAVSAVSTAAAVSKGPPPPAAEDHDSDAFGFHSGALDGHEAATAAEAAATAAAAAALAGADMDMGEEEESEDAATAKTLAAAARGSSSLSLSALDASAGGAVSSAASSGAVSAANVTPAFRLHAVGVPLDAFGHATVPVSTAGAPGPAGSASAADDGAFFALNVRAAEFVPGSGAGAAVGEQESDALAHGTDDASDGRDGAALADSTAVADSSSSAADDLYPASGPNGALDGQASAYRAGGMDAGLMSPLSMLQQLQQQQQQQFMFQLASNPLGLLSASLNGGSAAAAAAAAAMMVAAANGNSFATSLAPMSQPGFGGAFGAGAAPAYPGAFPAAFLAPFAGPAGGDPDVGDAQTGQPSRRMADERGGGKAGRGGKGRGRDSAAKEDADDDAFRARARQAARKPGVLFNPSSGAVEPSATLLARRGAPAAAAAAAGRNGGRGQRLLLLAKDGGKEAAAGATASGVARPGGEGGATEAAASDPAAPSALSAVLQALSGGPTNLFEQMAGRIADTRRALEPICASVAADGTPPNTAPWGQLPCPVQVEVIRRSATGLPFTVAAFASLQPATEPETSKPVPTPVSASDVLQLIDRWEAARNAAADACVPSALNQSDDLPAPAAVALIAPFAWQAFNLALVAAYAYLITFRVKAASQRAHRAAKAADTVADEAAGSVHSSAQPELPARVWTTHWEAALWRALFLGPLKARMRLRDAVTAYTEGLEAFNIADAAKATDADKAAGTGANAGSAVAAGAPQAARARPGARAAVRAAPSGVVVALAAAAGGLPAELQEDAVLGLDYRRQRSLWTPAGTAQKTAAAADGHAQGGVHKQAIAKPLSGGATHVKPDAARKAAAAESGGKKKPAAIQRMLEGTVRVAVRTPLLADAAAPVATAGSPSSARIQGAPSAAPGAISGNAQRAAASPIQIALKAEQANPSLAALRTQAKADARTVQQFVVSAASVLSAILGAVWPVLAARPHTVGSSEESVSGTESGNGWLAATFPASMQSVVGLSSVVQLLNMAALTASCRDELIAAFSCLRLQATLPSLEQLPRNRALLHTSLSLSSALSTAIFGSPSPMFSRIFFDSGVAAFGRPPLETPAADVAGATTHFLGGLLAARRLQVSLPTLATNYDAVPSDMEALLAAIEELNVSPERMLANLRLALKTNEADWTKYGLQTKPEGAEDVRAAAMLASMSERSDARGFQLRTIVERVLGGPVSSAVETHALEASRTAARLPFVRALVRTVALYLQAWDSCAVEVAEEKRVEQRQQTQKLVDSFSATGTLAMLHVDAWLRKELAASAAYVGPKERERQRATDQSCATVLADSIALIIALAEVCASMIEPLSENGESETAQSALSRQCYRVLVTLLLGFASAAMQYAPRPADNEPRLLEPWVAASDLALEWLCQSHQQLLACLRTVPLATLQAFYRILRQFSNALQPRQHAFTAAAANKALSLLNTPLLYSAVSPKAAVEGTEVVLAMLLGQAAADPAGKKTLSSIPCSSVAGLLDRTAAIVAASGALAEERLLANISSVRLVKTAAAQSPIEFELVLNKQDAAALKEIAGDENRRRAGLGAAGRVAPHTDAAHRNKKRKCAVCRTRLRPGKKICGFCGADAATGVAANENARTRKDAKGAGGRAGGAAAGRELMFADFSDDDFDEDAGDAARGAAADEIASVDTYQDAEKWDDFDFGDVPDELLDLEGAVKAGVNIRKAVEKSKGYAAALLRGLSQGKAPELSAGSRFRSHASKAKQRGARSNKDPIKETVFKTSAPSRKDARASTSTAAVENHGKFAWATAANKPQPASAALNAEEEHPFLAALRAAPASGAQESGTDAGASGHRQWQGDEKAASRNVWLRGAGGVATTAAGDERDELPLEADFDASAPAPLAEQGDGDGRGGRKALIVLDAPSVAMKAGGGRFFHVAGIVRAIRYYQFKGHRVVAFIPEALVKNSAEALQERAQRAGIAISTARLPDDLATLRALVRKRVLFASPATSIDEPYALCYAQQIPGACFVSNERFEGWLHTLSPALRKVTADWLRLHRVAFSFTGTGAGGGVSADAIAPADGSATAASAPAVDMDYRPSAFFRFPSPQASAAVYKQYTALLQEDVPVTTQGAVSELALTELRNADDGPETSEADAGAGAAGLEAPEQSSSEDEEDEEDDGEEDEDEEEGQMENDAAVSNLPGWVQSASASSASDARVEAVDADLLADFSWDFASSLLPVHTASVAEASAGAPPLVAELSADAPFAQSPLPDRATVPSTLLLPAFVASFSSISSSSMASGLLGLSALHAASALSGGAPTNTGQYAPVLSPSLNTSSLGETFDGGLFLGPSLGLHADDNAATPLFPELAFSGVAAAGFGAQPLGGEMGAAPRGVYNWGF